MIAISKVDKNYNYHIFLVWNQAVGITKINISYNKFKIKRIPTSIIVTRKT